MKKTLLALAVFATAKLFAQTIPNGGFEAWNNGTYMDPLFYMTSNDNFNGNAINNFMGNCIRTSPAYHGNYAVQLTTIKNGTDTLAGYMVDGSPNGNVIHGGIPYNQKPTGIRLYYKYSTMATDSALVIAWFKKSGSVIGTYPFKIHALQSNYTLFAGTFSPALAVTPDTVVFAAASSVTVMNNSAGAPIGSVFTIDSVSFTGVGSQPADLNGDFENWTPVDTFFIPSGWYVNLPERWSTDRHAGNYSVQMSTEMTPNGVSAGQVSTGYNQCPNQCMNNCNCVLKGGHPYTQTSDSLTFWYKYAPVGGDTAWLNLAFIKDTVFSWGGLNLFGTGGQWMYAGVAINLPRTPDTAIVSFGSSYSHNNGPLPSHIGSVLKIDNVQFKSQPLAVNNLQDISGNIGVYPNPNHGVFQVRISGGGNETNNIEVYNMLGQQVVSQPNMQGSLLNVDLSSQPGGVYLLRIVNGNGTVTGTQEIVKF